MINGEIGIVGLGVMGRNFLLNLADHNFNVAGYDIDINKVNSLKSENNPHIGASGETEEFVSMLRVPRAVMLLVPAGPPVDSAIKNLVNHLKPGDIIIDAGNSNYIDTDTRAHDLEIRGIRFMGVGVSGGEEGARTGASIMPGGPVESWERVRPVFEAAAARVDGLPCVALLGSGSSGHFVKMVHNGIEYGIMQLISETYDLMKRGLGMDDDQLHDIYNEWNRGDMNSYLLGITSDIFTVHDEKTENKLINEILDVARQKGTGMWTSQSAMELQVPVPSIDAAVSMRNLSAYKEERKLAGNIFSKPVIPITGDKNDFLSKLKNAYFTGALTIYAQGMALLAAASGKYRYGLKLSEVSRIWKGGCIIRAALLNNIYDVFSSKPDLPNLLLDKNFSSEIIKYNAGLREIIIHATSMGIPVPSMMASLAYLDAFRSEWLPANLIQAQRDYFGSHTYERNDSTGTFHTEWSKILFHENISS